MADIKPPQIMVIAVDGPAASGKGTLSRRIAKHYGLNYLDTGSLYRAVAVAAMRDNVLLDDVETLVRLAKGLQLGAIADDALRQPGVGEAASKIAGVRELRTALLQLQRAFAATPPGAVLDGRDIGTVVCPNADVKLFVTASQEERARRRFKELAATNPALKFQEIFDEIKCRDARDQARAAAPLSQAPDAHLLDTTNLDIEAAMDAAVHLIDQTVAVKE